MVKESNTVLANVSEIAAVLLDSRLTSWIIFQACSIQRGMTYTIQFYR